MNADLMDLCRRSLLWARARDYRGHDKHDAMASPLLRGLLGWSRWGRLATTVAVNRSPVNLRPLLGVPRLVVPKGLALFARAWLTLSEVSGREDDLAEGLALLDRLRGLSRAADFSGRDCWGYPFPWENRRFFVQADEPNTVVVCFVAETFVQGYDRIGRADLLDVAESAARFLLNDLRWFDVDPGQACCSYDLHSDFRVVNVNAMVAALLARIHARRPNAALAERAGELMAWVLGRRLPDGGWSYADPPRASHVSQDNYHTGFVIDALRAFLEVFPDAERRDLYRRELTCYRDRFFGTAMAPRWRPDRRLPHDIHGAATGIVTFARAAGVDPAWLATAEGICNWTLGNLRAAGSPRFMYQKGRWTTARYTLMRWSQAWMCHAMAELARARIEAGRQPA
ncbi:MAG: hypothetical protein BIFFINMI_02568 [Phycisphaerae bacterium]|nr:hypothetical protein [Phycisphaerae bacterium]